jgi:WD40 repeat protein
MLLFVACEYEPSGNNFLELTPPENNVPIEISLNDINPSDTIYLYKNTIISIKISSPVDLQQASVLLDGERYENMGSNTLGFTFYPDQMDEGVHKLTVDATFTSGSGSLAEMMGLEGYKGELSWNIRVIHYPQGRFKVNYRVNKEGFFELFWNNAIPDSYIQRYTIDLLETHEPQVTINDAHQKSFVDYGYVCKYAYYQIKAYLKDGTIFTSTLSVDVPAPKVHFEDLGVDSLRVYWDKPYANARVNLIEENNTIASGILDTSIIIPQNFGKTRPFHLEMTPLKDGYDYYQTKSSDWSNFHQGTSLGLPNWDLYAYSIKDNIIFTSKYDNLVALNATSLQQINTVPIMGHPWGFAYGGKIAAAPHNSTVAAMTGEETWIFTDSRFINPIKISPLRGDVNTRLCALTSNDRFFVVQQDANICKVFNSLTGEKILELPFTYKTIYTFPDLVTVSENGQFFCASSDNGIEIFEIKGTSTTLLYTDTRLYKGAMFIPSQPDKLLIRVGTDIEIRQLPNFTLIQRLDVSVDGAILCNIDPASMSLLYHQNDSLKVCKIDNLAETIFKLKSDERTCKMFNNKILTYGKGGMCFDINPYLSN